MPFRGEITACTEESMERTNGLRGQNEVIYDVKTIIGRIFVLYVILFSNLMHIFFIKSIAFLYMFRALLCSSSGGLNCIYTASGS
jgi:hypothetical protein